MSNALGVPVRLATSCPADTAEAITDAVTALIQEFQHRNDCRPSAVRMAVFTATSDLRSVKPAKAARHAGWDHVPMLCLAEMPTDDDLPRCIRVLVFVDRGSVTEALKPVYLNGTHVLRPDLAAD